MEPWAVVALVLGMALVLATAVAARRGRELARHRAAAGVATDGEAEVAIERSREARERAERALGNLRLDVQTLLDASDLGILRLDRDLMIVAANGAAATVAGRRETGLVGLGLIEAFLDADIEATARESQTGGVAAREIQLRRPDSPILLVRARRTTDGGVWLLLADVSELRRLQQIRTEFIDNLSHELRTPLTSIGLLAETLARETATLGDAVPAKVRDRIGRIEVETGHLSQMVAELLDLSRIESGRMLALVDDVDLGELARASVERLRLFAERQGTRLQVLVEPNLPHVLGDEARLGQVFVNLLHNAVKFSPDGGAVTVAVRNAGPEIVASVEDQGMGIPRSAQPRIFERFYKVDRARVRGQGGTGLGLSIARHIVEQHGGRIWVRSSEGQGSTFSFAIPIPPGGG